MVQEESRWLILFPWIRSVGYVDCRGMQRHRDHSCPIDSLAPNASATITINAVPILPGTFANRASVSSGTRDGNPANNAASVSATVMNLNTMFPVVQTSMLSPAEGESENEQTGFAVVNLSNRTATLSFSGYDRSGVLVSGADITNSKSVTLRAGEQMSFLASQVFGSGSVARNLLGYVNLDSNVSELLGLFLVFSNSGSVLDGAEIPRRTATSLVLPELNDQGSNQLQILNSSTTESRVSFELVKSDGTVRVPPVTRTLAGRGTLNEELATLFGTPAVASDYIRATSSQGVALFSFRGKERQFIEALTGQNATTGSLRLYAPQYVVGGRAWRSSLSIVNLDNIPGTVSLRFISDDGVQIGQTQHAEIVAQGKVLISDQDLFVRSATTMQGYLEILSSGPRLTGSIVFGDYDRSQFSTALPLVTNPTTEVYYSHVVSNATYFTGLSIANPGIFDLHVTIEVFKSSGELLASTKCPFPRNGDSQDF